MAKPLSSFVEADRERVVARRLAAVENGLGKLSAQDYRARKAAKPKAAKVAEVKSE